MGRYHFGERARNEYGGNFRAAWQHVLWPLVGAYQVLTEDVPVGIVNDDQLEHNEIDGYRLLVLPNADRLSAAQRRAVTAFGSQGGIVVENIPAWPWSDPEAGTAAADAFRAAMQAQIRAAPLQVRGGPNGRYAVAYQGPERLVVAVTNDFSWVQIRWTSDTIKTAAAPATGVRVTWRKDANLVQGLDRTGRLRAVEAVSGSPLRIEESSQTYRVTLPRFKFLALLVVSQNCRIRCDNRQRAKVGE